MTKERAHKARAGSRRARQADRGTPWLALGGILLLTFLVFAPSLGNDFTNWDDPPYVTGNPLVAHPRLPDVLITPVLGSYNPLAILSLALNYRISGYDPASYHWLNLVLHLANTALVFLFAWRLSRQRFWTSAATSLLFGVHPMHVESVAWVTERKDVLYAFFYLLGLIGYLRWLEHRRWTAYAACLAAFVLALASKPAAVVFPLTLLAVDSFLQRTDRRRLLLEKLPFLALSVAAGLLTLQAGHAGEAAGQTVAWRPFDRLLFAAFGSVMYVLRLFIPVGLSAIYPYPDQRSSIGPEYYAALVIMVIALPTVLILCRRLRPVLFGWAFFFINIALVLQFVTVGQGVMADRFTYVPYIGLLLGLTWWLDERPLPGSAGSLARKVIATMLVAMLPVCCYQAWTRCGVWKNSETLWRDTIRKFPHRIPTAYDNLGLALAGQGRTDEAIAAYHEALRLDNGFAGTHDNLGTALNTLGRSDEAIAQFREAIRLDGSFALAHYNLGIALGGRGRTEEAIAQFREAIRLDGSFAAAHNNLGMALAAQGRLDEAIAQYREALRLDDGTGTVHNNLGVALGRLGRFEEAAGQFRRALELEPENTDFESNLSKALEASGSPR